MAPPEINSSPPSTSVIVKDSSNHSTRSFSPSSTSSPSNDANRTYPTPPTEPVKFSLYPLVNSEIDDIAEQLSQGVADIALDGAQDEEWEVIARKAETRAGKYAVKPPIFQNSNHRAWGQADTMQMVGLSKMLNQGNVHQYLDHSSC